MKTALTACVLGLVAAMALADSRISDLPLSNNPSTNTFIEIADMNAVTKSAKVLLQFDSWTNLTTYIAPAAQPALFQIALSNSTPNTKILMTNGAAAFMHVAPTGLTNQNGSGLFWDSASSNHNVNVDGGSILAVDATSTNANLTAVVASIGAIAATSANQTVYLGDAGIAGIILDGKGGNVTTQDGAAQFSDVQPGHTNFFSTVFSGSIGATRTAGANERLVAQLGSLAMGNDLDAANYTWLFGSHYTNRTGGFTVGYSGVPSLFANASGVGMRTNAPSQALEVNGNIKASDGFVIMIGTNTLSISGTNIIVNGVTR